MLLPAAALAAAPDVVLRDVTGKERHASEFFGRGKWTVVAVWSVDCTICQSEIPHLAFFHDAHRQRDAVVLGVSIDGLDERARVVKFIDEHGLTFPNLIGDAADISRFGAGRFKGTPTYLFFSPGGQLVTQRVGATPLDEIERTIAAPGARR